MVVQKLKAMKNFFKKYLINVNEKNHFILNDKSLIKDGPYSLKFELIFGDITHTFCIGSGGDNNEEEKNGKNAENPEEKKRGRKTKRRRKKRGEKKGRERKT